MGVGQGACKIDAHDKADFGLMHAPDRYVAACSAVTIP
jgi:hypothetical protein